VGLGLEQRIGVGATDWGWSNGLGLEQRIGVGATDYPYNDRRGNPLWLPLYGCTIRVSYFIKTAGDSTKRLEFYQEILNDVITRTTTKKSSFLIDDTP